MKNIEMKSMSDFGKAAILSALQSELDEVKAIPIYGPDIVSLYRRNQEKFCDKNYHDIRKSAWRRGAWYKLSRLKCRTLVAKRLGPDGENLYEPYGK